MSNGQIYTLIFFVLAMIVFDVVLVRQSKRKKKYVIYPAIGTAGLIVLSSALFLFMVFSPPEEARPSLGSYRKSKDAIYLYQSAQKNYRDLEDESNAEVKGSKPYFRLLVRCLKMQLAIGLALAVYGKMVTSRRDTFYTISISTYVLCLFLVILFASQPGF